MKGFDKLVYIITRIGVDAIPEFQGFFEDYLLAFEEFGHPHGWLNSGPGFMKRFFLTSENVIVSFLWSRQMVDMTICKTECTSQDWLDKPL